MQVTHKPKDVARGGQLPAEMFSTSNINGALRRFDIRFDFFISSQFGLLENGENYPYIESCQSVTNVNS